MKGCSVMKGSGSNTAKFVSCYRPFVSSRGFTLIELLVVMGNNGRTAGASKRMQAITMSISAP